MTDKIPVIDIGDHLAGRPGALQMTAQQVHDALTTVGFFVLTGHDVPLSLVEHTFAEARRFHAMPMERKLALKLNENNNGYMVMGRYAVRTSDLNNNDKGDLNEAFFVKRERPANDPLLLSGRRFVGPNLWPNEADLPGFRANVLDPDSPDEMAFSQLRALITAVKSNSYAGSSSRILTDPTGERRNWQFRQRFRGLRSCRPNPSGESGFRGADPARIAQYTEALSPCTFDFGSENNR